MIFYAKSSNMRNLKSNAFSLLLFITSLLTFKALADIEVNILSNDNLQTSFDTPAIKAISTNVILVRGIAPLIPLTSVGLIPDWCYWPILRGFPLGRNYLDITNKGFLSCLSRSLGLVVPYLQNSFGYNIILNLTAKSTFEEVNVKFPNLGTVTPFPERRILAM